MIRKYRFGNPLNTEAVVKEYPIDKGEIPCIEVKEGEKIYVPCLSKALNLIYAREPLKLNEAPYDVIKKDFAASLIDPFDEYGFNIYDSLFSRLLKLGEKIEWRKLKKSC